VYTHQQWCAVRFSTFLCVVVVVLAEYKLYTNILFFVHILSLLHDAAEGADFHTLDTDPVGVAGVLPKLK